MKAVIAGSTLPVGQAYREDEETNEQLEYEVTNETNWPA